MKIGVLSDTHNYLPKKAIHYLEGCDEIWHGGDIGSINVLEKLESGVRGHLHKIKKKNRIRNGSQYEMNK